MRITHLKIQGTSQWRWLLVLPAVLIGYLVPGFLIRIAWEVGWSWIPGMDFLMTRVAEFLQVAVAGFCSVFFAGYVAPRRARVVRLAAATMTVIGLGGSFIYVLLTGYYQGVPTVEVSWQIVGWVTHAFTAIAAGSIRDTPPTTGHSQRVDSRDAGDSRQC